ncbi:hypothetical protein HDV05_004101 [Chytridiales sp. JEL 0842]|nr:hypothetical protein HDV05_004101 [Chytridiales sp. JEL 0842]
MLRFLLHQNANPTIPELPTKATPLHLASAIGNLEIAGLLLSSGVNRDAQMNDTGSTPLHLAIGNRRWEMVRFLCGSGVSMKVLDREGLGGLHYAVTLGEGEGVGCLVEEGLGEVDLVDGDGRTGLYLATVLGDAGVVERLLKVGAKAGLAVGSLGETVVHVAVRLERFEIAKAILEASPGLLLDLDRNQEERFISKGLLPPLYLATKLNKPYFVKLFIQHGAPLSWNPFYETTPLHIAVCLPHDQGPTILKLLLNAGADPNTSLDSKKRTPLYLAAAQNKFQCATILLCHGVQPESSSSNGKKSPLWKACVSGHVEMVELLVGWRAKMGVSDGYSWRVVAGRKGVEKEKVARIGEILKRG